MTFNTLDGLLTELLDRGYERATRRVLESIAGSLSSGRVGRRLDELEIEAARLEAEGARLDPDNPVFRALVFDVERELQRAAARVDAAGVDVQAAGVGSAGRIQKGLAIGTFDEGVVGRLGLRWNTPDPEAVAALVNFVDSPAWDNVLRRYPADIVTAMNNQAIRGIAQGWGPLRAAREIRRTATGLAPHMANNLLRTLHLESYRTATAIHQRANADLAEKQIRIEVLDQRTCLACIALHGTEMPIGAKVEDHHQGRGTSMLVLRGRERNIQTGQDWFNNLTDEERAGLAAFQRSPGKLEAIRSGRAGLSDFIQTYDDPVFGRMVREGSLADALGGGSDYTPPPPGGAPPVPAGGGDLPGRGSGGRVLSLDGEILDDPPEVSDIEDLPELTGYLFSDGARARYMWDMRARMPKGSGRFKTYSLEKIVEGFNEDGTARINKDNLYQAIKDYVIQSRAQEVSRVALQRTYQESLAALGFDVSPEEAEAIYNRDEARRADTFLILSKVTGLKLTEPQRTRLERARRGEYSDMSFEEVGDDGTVINAMERARASGGGSNSAEARSKRDDYNRIFGLGDYLDERQARDIREASERFRGTDTGGILGF